ncbi:MAG: 3-phosphoshikimate 1-carboxyvinyltransferase [Methanomicrobiales archaeon]|nr:3-phosphoshikimate 1-carboxyvinyltransferase [Methanomicrobiales archaeon]
MEIEIKKKEGIDAEFIAPPSKSHTHRALIASSLADGDSLIHGPLLSDDIMVTVASLKEMGVVIERNSEGFAIDGCGGALNCERGCVLDMRDSGTSMRFFSALALLGRGHVTITGSRRLRERPLGPLAKALGMLGGEVVWLEREGYAPLRISGSLEGGTAVISASESSQYISAILLVAPCARRDVTLTCEGRIVSRPYIDVTLEIMRLFGADVQREGYSVFGVRSGRNYRGREYRVEGDYSSAGYFLAIGAVCGGRVRVRNLLPESRQADAILLGAFERMGCRISSGPEGVVLESSGTLDGIEIDMSDAPDAVQTLSMVAAFATTPSTIRGIRHLRWKESDRVEAITDVLVRAGASVKADEDSLTIWPSKLHGAEIDPKGDHRTAMSATILGLGTGGFMIRNAECVSKSFPGFWRVLEGAGLL